MIFLFPWCDSSLDIIPWHDLQKFHLQDAAEALALKEAQQEAEMAATLRAQKEAEVAKHWQKWVGKPLEVS